MNRLCHECTSPTDCASWQACEKGHGEEVNKPLSQEDIDHAVSVERERCAKLTEFRGQICRVSADKIRKTGTFNGQQLTRRFPFILNVPLVAGKWEARARDMEAVANAFESVARIIRSGVPAFTEEDGEKFLKEHVR